MFFFLIIALLPPSLNQTHPHTHTRTVTTGACHQNNCLHAFVPPFWISYCFPGWCWRWQRQFPFWWQTIIQRRLALGTIQEWRASFGIKRQGYVNKIIKTFPLPTKQSTSGFNDRAPLKPPQANSTHAKCASKAFTVIKVLRVFEILSKI